MDQIQSKNIEPQATVHRSLAELEAALNDLPVQGKDAGRVAMIVRRNAPGMHEALSTAHISAEEGVPGDEWNRRLPKNPEAQLTVMQRDVAELVSNGQPLTLPGDNLIVDLDISASNLPIGTRLRVGEAVVEVSPKPHNGCSKFAGRFGQDAVRFVNAPATRDRNLRGIYWKVIQDGKVEAGSAIQVIFRPKVTGL